MNGEQVITRLRDHEAELRRRGVRHAALFGSVARGKAGPESDIDIFIELDPEAPIGVYQYVDIQQFIRDLFSDRVDVSNRKTLKAYVRQEAERDAVFAF
jgi:predicted nucleotidyltransferase